ncbi:nucleoside triphosphate pyrophosphatase [Kordiimonas sp. SCSIO 12610]|uniref:Maf family protein n=1 Tax=Kordiimonas sp. SCSIO 12610 TaxID=2829597 RepID=UPI00210B73FB|nr:Maf family protein [Kordiimonas sp. SCSIO 12610]UTW55690.1 septum formation protein Maf [Kordiimonas sp. SCSIO 12610]
MTTSPSDGTTHNNHEVSRARTSKLVLASASPRRKDLLSQISLDPDIIDPADIDETSALDENPKSYALRISREKAETVAKRHHGNLILSADTVVACGNRILPKAEDQQTAVKCLHMLSGRRHRVLTGMALVLPNNRIIQKVVTTTVAFKPLSAADIDRYIKSNEWNGKAGGYAIQGLGACFVRFISGSYSNVVGLPLFEVNGWLEAHLFQEHDYD